MPSDLSKLSIEAFDTSVPLHQFRKGCRPSIVSISEEPETSPNPDPTTNNDSRRGSAAVNQPELINVLVLGGAKVGKTALINQFLYDRFPTEYRATVEQLHRGEYNVKGDLLTLEILDTSGHYYFPAMRRLEIKRARVIVFVFAVDQLESFDEIRRLREFVVELRPTGVPMVVVANKTDLALTYNRRTVQKEISETVARIDWECGYVECSAKEGINVLDVFKEVLAQCRVNYALSPAVKRRRRSLPVEHTQPRLKPLVALKRNSCVLS